MDITPVFGTVIPGSNPGESTKVRAKRVFCAFEVSGPRQILQDSKDGTLRG